MKNYYTSLFALPLLLTTTAYAENFSGEAELGWITTSGNSETENLAFKAKAEKVSGKFTHKANLEALNASSTSNGEQTRTAERYLAAYKLKYNYSEKNYSFIATNYERDRFSGYDHQTSELLGYGRQLLNDETLKASAEIAFGARQSKLDVKPVDGDDNKNEGVVKLQGDLNWKISDSTVFTEELSVEAGEENTISKSVSGLKVNINSSLAMKLTYTVKHNSEVPADKRNTDSERIVTLVYSF